MMTFTDISDPIPDFYATCDNSDDAQMSDFSFGIPSGATINGIQVVTEMAEGASADNILVDFSLSWNDGSSFTSVKTATVDGTTDTDYTVGGSSDTWGRTWTDTELANGTFRLRLDKNPSVDNLFVDYLRVKVSYTTGGGTSTTTTAYIHTDHLSGTSAITNDHKDIIQVLDYYPYGSIRVNTKEPTAHFDEKRKFTGYEYDSSTGLNYAGARYQSPSEGRFTGQDPASRDNPGQFSADPQQMNMYSYARGNPIKNIDPDGKQVVEAVLSSPYWVPVAVAGAVGILTSIDLAIRADRGFYQRQIPDIGLPDIPSMGDTGPSNWNPKVPWWARWIIPGAALVGEVVDYMQKREGIDDLNRESENQSNNQKSSPTWQQGGTNWQQGGNSANYTSPTYSSTNNSYSSSSSDPSSQQLQSIQSQINQIRSQLNDIQSQINALK